jgi:hypothetical protein
MAAAEGKVEATSKDILTPEQEAILDRYLLQLDAFLENIKASEKIQVEIETLHLKRITHR